MTDPVLSLRALNRATLARQMLLERARLPVPEAVERLAGLQAQHPDWPRVALWSRVSALASQEPARSLQRRQIVRASLMRITVHIVSAADYWPFLFVTLAGRQEQFRLLFKEDPNDRRVMKRLRPAHAAAIAALGEAPRSKAELRTILAAAAPREARRPHDYLWRHFAATVPLVDVPPPDGPARYGRSWYARAVDWLGEPPDVGEEAIGHLVARYLAAYGPASREDLVAWSGRRITDLKPGLAQLEDRLIRFRDDAGRELIDLQDAPRPPPDATAPARFLARWDALLLGHAPKLRTRVLPAEFHKAVNRPNGDVLATFLVDGYVAGTWKHAPATRTSPSTLELSPLRGLATRERRELLHEAGQLAAFLSPGSEVEVRLGGS
jgi:hypothetical protein